MVHIFNFKDFDNWLEQFPQPRLETYSLAYAINH